jgi:Protein of unknown function (DUF559)
MADAWSVCRDIRGKTTADIIGAFAERQHGVVARRQLEKAGLSRYVVDRRIKGRLLRVVHRGVYAVGHLSMTAEGHWMAAVLAAGPEAALSHRAAGALWLLRANSYLEVTAPIRRRRPGIRIHRSMLPEDEITTHRGIPVTTVPRTLLDLAAVLRPSQVARALNEAEIQRPADPLSLLDLLERYPRRPGTPVLRTLLGNGVQLTRSELEARFLDFVQRSGLPQPATNAWLQIHGTWIECDCLWRAERLIVELDGHAVHGTRAAFEADRARDRALQAEGWRVVRITWHQLQYNAQPLARDLRAVLTRPSL